MSVPLPFPEEFTAKIPEKIKTLLEEVYEWYLEKMGREE